MSWGKINKWPMGLMGHLGISERSGKIYNSYLPYSKDAANKFEKNLQSSFF
jgi:hypothetical protein